MALLDQYGRPINVARLKEDVVAPTVMGVRSIIAGHPADGLTPGRLAGILRQAEAGDPRAYLELAEQMEEKDLHYLSVLGTRKRQVAQLEVTIEAASDAEEDQTNADLAREWLGRDTLEDDNFDVLDAVGKGFSLNQLIWDHSERQWWPDRIEYVEPRWIRFDELTGQIPMLLDDAGLPQHLDGFKFIRHRVRAKSGLPIRSGLARPVAWAWMFKNYSVKDWVAFAEVYGMPLRVGRYENGASAEDKRTLLRAVADIGADAAAIVPKSMDIEFVDGKGGTADGGVFKALAEWFDFQVSKAVLGQTATTDSVTGGLGSGAEHNDVRGDIERADAKTLGSTLSRDIIRPLVDLNRGPPRSGKYPRVMVGRAEAWNPEKMMPAVESYVRLGGRVEKSVIGDRLGLPEAPDGADILTAPAATTPAGNPPQDGTGGPPPLLTPANAARAASHPSHRLSAGLPVRTAAARSAPVAGGRDQIDDLVDEAVGDGEWVTAPLAATIDDILASCSSLEEARHRLAEAAQQMDVAAFADRLARATFSARLAGVAGVDLHEDQA